MTAKEYLSNLTQVALPEEVADANAVFHFDFGDDQNYTVLGKDGKIEFHESLVGTPDCSIKASAEDFMSIVNGETNPMMAMMMGKLKITNPGVMLKYAKIFGIM